MDTIQALFAIALVLIVVLAGRKALASSSAAPTLEPGEEPIAHILVKTRDRRLRHRGFMFSSTTNEGKLVLTRKRLLYTTYAGKRITWAVPIAALSGIFRNFDILNYLTLLFSPNAVILGSASCGLWLSKYALFNI